MHTPTHAEITTHAEKLWQDQGSPSGCDDLIWLEAEQELTAKASHLHTAPIPGEPALPKLKEAARTQQSATKSAPKTTPTQSGKPLWSKPHSR